MTEIHDAARTIRSYLPELLGVEDAQRLDSRLADLLAAPATEEVILVELERYDATAEWTAGFMQYGVPAEFALVAERGYDEVPGHGERVRLPKFACPRGDFVWYRHAVGETPPRCPTHGLAVERVAAN